MKDKENIEFEEQLQYCPCCEKKTFQSLELYEPDDIYGDLIWVCEECKEATSFH